jgi:urease gamma subunit
MELKVQQVHKELLVIMVLPALMVAQVRLAQVVQLGLQEAQALMVAQVRLVQAVQLGLQEAQALMVAQVLLVYQV